MMEDGTGVAEVRKWIDQNEGNEEIQRRRELTYGLFDCSPRCQLYIYMFITIERIHMFAYLDG